MLDEIHSNLASCCTLLNEKLNQTEFKDKYQKWLTVGVHQDEFNKASTFRAWLEKIHVLSQQVADMIDEETYNG